MMQQRPLPCTYRCLQNVAVNYQHGALELTLMLLLFSLVFRATVGAYTPSYLRKRRSAGQSVACKSACASFPAIQPLHRLA